MNVTIEQGLLAALTGLVGALIWLVKAMNVRSYKLIEQRDHEVARLITTLEKAVDAFALFQTREDDAHGHILKKLTEIDEHLPLSGT